MSSFDPIEEAAPATVALTEPRADGEPLLEDADPLADPAADVWSVDPHGRWRDEDEVRAAIEALLFASPEPLSPKAIARALPGVAEKSVRAQLRRLLAETAAAGRGVQLLEVPGGYALATRERYAEFILRLGLRRKRPALTSAALETLAIVAYRQPIIRAEIESIRGVESSGVLRNLLDLGLIEVVGRKEILGRPALYGTTTKFLTTFGLKRLGDLPPIEGLTATGMEAPTPAPAASLADPHLERAAPAGPRAQDDDDEDDDDYDEEEEEYEEEDDDEEGEDEEFEDDEEFGDEEPEDSLKRSSAGARPPRPL